MFDQEKAKTLMMLSDPLLEKWGVKVVVKRDDLVHPVAGGNKWRKLKYNLESAKGKNKTVLVTFGGAYSNHIAATAWAGKETGFKTIGIIRGEKTDPLNITLKRAEQCGMKLVFTDRTTYRDKELALKTALKDTDSEDVFIIPEGGNNEDGFKGCCEIVPEIEIGFNYICCPCGTGTTLAGIAASLKSHQQALGFSVMKNNPSIEPTVKNYLKNETSHFRVFNEYHFGGYAKSNRELDNFIKEFSATNKIAVDPVYTGKMFYGIYDLLQKGFFKKGDVIIAVHTGGLQYLMEQ